VRTSFLLLASVAALSGSDALFDAARQGDVAAVKAQLDSGVPVDATWRYGQTALFIAAGRGHTEVVKLLIDRGAKPDVKDSFYGFTAVSAAAQKGSVETVMLLLDKGATGADEMLVGAAGQGQVKLLEALLARPGWKPEVLTKALSAATGRGKPDAAALLKKHGAQPRPAVAVAPETLARYAGRYRIEGTELAVTASDGKLNIGGAGMPAMPCTFLDQTSCEPDRFAGAMTVTFVDGGMEIRQGSSVQKFVKESAK
jgi:hypothetical protein